MLTTVHIYKLHLFTYSITLARLQYCGQNSATTDRRWVCRGKQPCHTPGRWMWSM